MAIDPSLTRTGVCAIDYEPLVGGGVANDYTVLEAVKVAKASKKVSYVERARVMVHETMELLGLIEPSEVVIEVPEGRVTGRHGGGGSGLAKYGFVVGWMYQALLENTQDILENTQDIPFEVYAVGSSYWTQGFGAEKRKKKAVSRIKPLAHIKDPGGDIADAAALAVWWIDIGRYKPSCLSS